MLQGGYGLHELSMGVPVALGKDGVKEIVEYELTPDERESLMITVEALKEAKERQTNI